MRLLALLSLLLLRNFCFGLSARSGIACRAAWFMAAARSQREMLNPMFVGPKWGRFECGSYIVPIGSKTRFEYSIERHALWGCRISRLSRKQANNNDITRLDLIVAFMTKISVVQKIMSFIQFKSSRAEFSSVQLSSVSQIKSSNRLSYEQQQTNEPVSD